MVLARWRTVCAVALVAATIGCQPAAEAATATPRHISPAPSAASPTPTARPTGYSSYPDAPLGSGVRIVELAAGLTPHRIASSGPLVVFTALPEDAAPSQQVLMADLSKQTVVPIATAAPRHGLRLPSVDGAWVAWTDDGPTTSAVRVMNLFDGTTRTITTAPLAAVLWVHLAGGHAAVASASQPGRKDTIALFDLGTGQLVRTVVLDKSLESFATDGASISVSEGTRDEAGQVFDAKLFLSTAAAPAPKLIATAAYEVSMVSGRLVWLDDPSGSGDNQQVFTMSLPVGTPEPISKLPDGQSPSGAFWPSVDAGGVVAWQEQYFGDNTGQALVAWKPGDVTPSELVPVSAPIQTAASGGWLDWSSLDNVDNGVIGIHGVPLTSVPLP